MKTRTLVILAVLLLLVVVIGRFMAGRDRIPATQSPVAPTPQAVLPSASPTSGAPAAQSPASSSTLPPPSLPNPVQPTPSAVPPAMPVATTNSNPPVSLAPDIAEAVAQELDQANLMLRDYRTLMGANPEGTNAEIMKAVMGGNPRRATLGPPAGQRLNGNGELVDRWGTAYFFHQMTATHMEIHSAGPDQTFGTSDDIIHR